MTRNIIKRFSYLNSTELNFSY